MGTYGNPAVITASLMVQHWVVVLGAGLCNWANSKIAKISKAWRA